MQHRPVPRRMAPRAAWRGGAHRNVLLMRNRPSSASWSVAAAKRSWVAMPASTMIRRLLALGGKA